MILKIRWEFKTHRIPLQEQCFQKDFKTEEIRLSSYCLLFITITYYITVWEKGSGCLLLF